ncbi:hypothetical protein HGM15179_019493 [Zosterops borbonicus]|uniref:Uncharacterized protein n=1 Tax=Zosterops borbonicus TaxID=364589 RepID=A0A8K1DAI1_9PASS|nr:hypothetical protein HGM15179_019493 [Zosterops borbonicus]
MVMQYGLTNPYVQSLIDHIFTSGLLVPFDCKKLADAFLKPTQKFLWLVDWEQRVEAEVTENLSLPQEDPRQFATMDMLLGKGPHVNPQEQSKLDITVLQQSQRLAKEAFWAVSDMGLPKLSYITIRQGPKETFMGFLVHLRDALERVPGMSSNVKVAIREQLVVANVNPPVPENDILPATLGNFGRHDQGIFQGWNYGGEKCWLGRCDGGGSEAVSLAQQKRWSYVFLMWKSWSQEKPV